IQIGGFLGLWATLGVVILTAIIGTGLFRSQGLGALQTIRTVAAQGGNPAPEVAHGAMIVIAGVLLLTPGFFTDGVGFLLMSRRVRGMIIASVVAGIVSGIFGGIKTPPRHGGANHSPDRDADIEADYSFEEDSDSKNNR
nr:FxsA family protein [Pseudomonadota bacterium]